MQNGNNSDSRFLAKPRGAVMSPKRMKYTRRISTAFLLPIQETSAEDDMATNRLRSQTDSQQVVPKISLNVESEPMGMPTRRKFRSEETQTVRNSKNSLHLSTEQEAKQQQSNYNNDNSSQVEETDNEVSATFSAQASKPRLTLTLSLGCTPPDTPAAGARAIKPVGSAKEAGDGGLNPSPAVLPRVESPKYFTQHTLGPVTFTNKAEVGKPPENHALRRVSSGGLQPVPVAGIVGVPRSRSPQNMLPSDWIKAGVLYSSIHGAISAQKAQANTGIKPVTVARASPVLMQENKFPLATKVSGVVPRFTSMKSRGFQQVVELNQRNQSTANMVPTKINYAQTRDPRQSTNSSKLHSANLGSPPISRLSPVPAQKQQVFVSPSTAGKPSTLDYRSLLLAETKPKKLEFPTKHKSHEGLRLPTHVRAQSPSVIQNWGLSSPKGDSGAVSHLRIPVCYSPKSLLQLLKRSPSTGSLDPSSAVKLHFDYTEVQQALSPYESRAARRSS